VRPPRTCVARPSPMVGRWRGCGETPNCGCRPLRA